MSLTYYDLDDDIRPAVIGAGQTVRETMGQGKSRATPLDHFLDAVKHYNGVLVLDSQDGRKGSSEVGGYLFDSSTNAARFPVGPPTMDTKNIANGPVNGEIAGPTNGEIAGPATSGLPDDYSIFSDISPPQGIFEDML
jgi:hypothetical protein